MNTLTETFPAACLIFGLFCGLLALIVDHRERSRLKLQAILRRLDFPAGRKMIYQEDGKPLTWEDQ